MNVVERLQELFKQVHNTLDKCACNGCTVELKQAINVIENIIKNEVTNDRS